MCAPLRVGCARHDRRRIVRTLDIDTLETPKKSKRKERRVVSPDCDFYRHPVASECPALRGIAPHAHGEDSTAFREIAPSWGDHFVVQGAPAAKVYLSGKRNCATRCMGLGKNSPPRPTPGLWKFLPCRSSSARHGGPHQTFRYSLLIAEVDPR